MPLLLEIVTPDKRVLCEEVEHVLLPTETGELDILPGHIPLLSILQLGELRYWKNGVATGVAVADGFIQIRGDKVSILAQSAIDVDEIDPDAAEKARLEAEAALKEAREKGEDKAIIEELETKARFSVMQGLLRKH